MKLSAILLTMFSFARHVNSLSHSVRLATRAPLRLQSNSVQYGGTTHVVQSTIDPKNTALLLIEYQNEFVSEGGKLHPAVKPVMEASGMLRNSESVVDQARKKGVKIFHAPIMVRIFVPEFQTTLHCPVCDTPSVYLQWYRLMLLFIVSQVHGKL